MSINRQQGFEYSIICRLQNLLPNTTHCHYTDWNIKYLSIYISIAAMKWLLVRQWSGPDSTWTMLSHCLRNGALVTISYNIISAVHRWWAHVKPFLLINLAWPWLLVIKILVLVSSPLLSPESRARAKMHPLPTHSMYFLRVGPISKIFGVITCTQWWLLSLPWCWQTMVHVNQSTAFICFWVHGPFQSSESRFVLPCNAKAWTINPAKLAELLG